MENKNLQASMVATVLMLAMAMKEVMRERERICICDDYSIPTECAECCVDTDTRCGNHTILKCSRNDCQNKFHVGCIASLWHVDISKVDCDTYVCLKCQHSSLQLDQCWNELPEDSYDNKLKRLGLTYKFINEDRFGKRRKIKKMMNAIELCDVLPTSILDHLPKPYPSPFAMSEESVNKHVIIS